MNPLLSIAIGAGLMYLLDPKEGKQRRADLYRKVEDAEFLKTMEEGLKDLQGSIDSAAQKWRAKTAGSTPGAGASGAAAGETGMAGGSATGTATGTAEGASSVSEDTLSGKDERAG